MLWGEWVLGVVVVTGVLLCDLASDSCCYTTARKRISLEKQAEKRSGMRIVGIGGYKEGMSMISTWGYSRSLTDDPSWS